MQCVFINLYVCILTILYIYIFADSNFVRDTLWVMKSMEEGYRIQSVMLTAPNVLAPHVLQDVNISTQLPYTLCDSPNFPFSVSSHNQ